MPLIAIAIIAIICAVGAAAVYEAFAASPAASYERFAGRRKLYHYHGRYVIATEDPGFDTYTTVTETNGAALGKLGGITGQGDGRLPDWYTAATFVRYV